jgi:hypothetical protein
MPEMADSIDNVTLPKDVKYCARWLLNRVEISRAPFLGNRKAVGILSMAALVVLKDLDLLLPATQRQPHMTFY